MSEEPSMRDILGLAKETIERANRQLFNQDIVNKLNLTLALVQLDEAENKTEDEEVREIVVAMKKELIMYLKSLLNIG